MKEKICPQSCRIAKEEPTDKMFLFFLNIQRIGHLALLI